MLLRLSLKSSCFSVDQVFSVCWCQSVAGGGDEVRQCYHWYHHPDQWSVMWDTWDTGQWPAHHCCLLTVLVTGQREHVSTPEYQVRYHDQCQHCQHCHHHWWPGLARDSVGLPDDDKKVTAGDIVKVMLSHVWPRDDAQIRRTVVKSLAILVSAKLVNTGVPFIFRWEHDIVDTVRSPKTALIGW